MTVQEITSSQNPRIKELVRLSSQKKERSLSGLFVVESAKLVEEAALAGIGIEVLYRTDEAAEKYAPYLAPAQAACGSEVRITRPVAEKLAASQHTQGVFALCRIPEPTLTEESLSPQGRYLVLSSLQDPGNIGAVLRSALAFGCDGLILSDDCPDLYSPKVLRAAMGGVFRQPVLITRDLPGLIRRMQEKGIDTLAAALDRSAMTSDEARLDRDGVAVVIGNEGSGLSTEMIAACGKTVFIPISARSESLNASVAASIFLWEMRRRG